MGRCSDFREAYFRLVEQVYSYALEMESYSDVFDGGDDDNNLDQCALILYRGHSKDFDGLDIDTRYLLSRLSFRAFEDLRDISHNSLRNLPLPKDGE